MIREQCLGGNCPDRFILVLFHHSERCYAGRGADFHVGEAAGQQARTVGAGSCWAAAISASATSARARAGELAISVAAYSRIDGSVSSRRPVRSRTTGSGWRAASIFSTGASRIGLTAGASLFSATTSGCSWASATCRT